MQETSTNRVFLIGALVLGVVAAVFAFVYLNQAAGSDRGPKVKVVIAKVDLHQNASLDPERDLDTMEVSPEMKRLISEAVRGENMAVCKGQKINRTITAGSPILTADLAAPAVDLDIKDPYRALCIKAKDEQGLSGLLVPGDRVKIMVTVLGGKAQAAGVGAAGATGAYQSSLVLDQSLRVLAVGSRLARPRNQIMLSEASSSASELQSQQTVTLEVTEEQALKIEQQISGGSVTLLLCPPASK